MHAAVVSQYGIAPTWSEFADPEPLIDEVVVEVIAAGLHPRVRAQAAGSHYTSEGALPLIPGVDGVGRFPDGSIRYFAIHSDTRGSMGQYVAVDPRASVVLPDGVDPVAIAAAVNPVMSSWIALRQRIDFAAGSSVLVLGATGSAGRVAVQVAKHLGAARVVASGRSRDALDELEALGADVVIPLDDLTTLAIECTEVDVVLDYLWGSPAEQNMTALVTTRLNPAQPLQWISIGSIAGEKASIPSELLRATALSIVGSGQGSVGLRGYLQEIPAIVDAISDGTFTIPTTSVPMHQVQQAWTSSRGERAFRTVLTR